MYTTITISVTRQKRKEGAVNVSDNGNRCNKGESHVLGHPQLRRKKVVGIWVYSVRPDLDEFCLHKNHGWHNFEEKQKGEERLLDLRSVDRRWIYLLSFSELKNRRGIKGVTVFSFYRIYCFSYSYCFYYKFSVPVFPVCKDLRAGAYRDPSGRNLLDRTFGVPPLFGLLYNIMGTSGK